MEKSKNLNSKFIAVIFSIFNSFLLIPGTLGILLYTAILFGGKSWEYLYSRFFTLLKTSEGLNHLFTRAIPYLVFFIGCLLLTGYILRAFNKLKPKLQLTLWISSFIFNLPIPLIFIYFIFQAIVYLISNGFGNPSRNDGFRELITILLIPIWMTLSCVLSAIAFRRDLLENRKNKTEELV